jgi:MFS family permease
MRIRVNNRWVICLVAAGFFFYQYMQLTMFNILKPELITLLNTDAAVLSVISSLYFFGTVAFLIPAGIMLDVISTRKIMLTTMLVSLLGLYIFSTATTIYQAGLGRLIMGLSAGPVCLTAGLRLSARWFPEDRFALVSGIIIAIGMLGAIVAQTIYTRLIDTIGYAPTLQINILLGVIFFFIMYLLIVDCPPGKEHTLQQQMAYFRQHGFIASFKKVLFKAQNWYCGVFASLLNLPVFLIGALWGMMYLMQAFALSKTQASVVCAALFFGLLIGAPIVGYISDRRGARKPPMYVGLGVCFISTAMLLTIPNLAYWSLCILFFLIGFSSSAQNLAYAAASESNPPALTGSAMGLTALCIMIGGAVFQPVVGYLIEHGWDGAYLNNMPLYHPHSYAHAFWIMPIAYIVATVMVYLMRETNCKIAA